MECNNEPSGSSQENFGIPGKKPFAENFGIPSSVNMRDFCECRMEEILLLTKTLKESPYRGQVFQRLPKHMRRRQMSHYMKRLPRSLQGSNFSSLKSEQHESSVPKRPSRKYRRRVKNLLLEYNRRQRKSIWLETHIWHSKRFHMISKWGYKLPEKPSNKSFRACYRATAQHCFLQDMSYYNTIELKGFENNLLQGLQQCVSPNCGLTFAAKMYKSGLREGSVMLYHPNTYPYNVIGQISFLWKPVNDTESTRTLWIFTHPLLHDEIITVFKSLFDFQEENSSEVTVSENHLPVKSKCEAEDKVLKTHDIKNKKLKKCKVSENVKLETKNIPFIKIPKYKNSSGSVCMSLLKDTINRFRLTGPLSLAVVLEAFDVSFQKPCTSEVPESSTVETAEASNEESEESEESESPGTSLKRARSNSIEMEFAGPSKRMKKEDPDPSVELGVIEVEKKDENVWWYNYYKSEIHKNCLERQNLFFEKLKAVRTASELPPRMVLSVIVTDPRLVIPPKRTKSSVNTSEDAEVHFISSTDLDSLLCESPLWEPEIRDAVSKLKISTHEINQSRSKLIVPGSNVRAMFKEGNVTNVPIILIQRNGTFGTDFTRERAGFGTGFDIIIPAGWAMPIWLSLVLRGARTGGLRENKCLMFEANNLNDYFQPDSCAGEIESLEIFNNLKTAYFKQPPNKRPNYTKSGVVSPFYIPWKVLISDWKNHIGNDTANIESGNKEEIYYVLRENEKLAELDALIRNLSKVLKYNTPCKFNHSFKEIEMDCLVQVSLESLKKGIPNEFAMICLPTVEDVKKFKSDGSRPVEISHPDKNQKARKVLKMEHSKILKCLKRKRKKNKMNKMEDVEKKIFNVAEEEETSMDDSKRSKSPIAKDIIDDYNDKMKKLWLQEPQSIDSVINSCSRKIIGYVVLGGFSYSKAHGMGLGYVTLRGLLHMLETCYKMRVDPLILFRNTNNDRYNFGKIAVCGN